MVLNLSLPRNTKNNPTSNHVLNNHATTSEAPRFHMIFVHISGSIPASRLLHVTALQCVSLPLQTHYVTHWQAPQVCFLMQDIWLDWFCSNRRYTFSLIPLYLPRSSAFISLSHVFICSSPCCLWLRTSCFGTGYAARFPSLHLEPLLAQILCALWKWLSGSPSWFSHVHTYMHTYCTFHQRQNLDINLRYIYFTF